MNPLFQLDRDLFRMIHEGMRRAWLDPLVTALNMSGLGQVQGFALLVIGYTQPKVRGYVWLAFASAATAGLFRLGVMKVIGRMRPSNFDFAKPMEDVFGRSSFPSGHTTTSFAIAVAITLALRGKDSVWIGKALLVWAMLVGIARIYAGVHYPSDVLGGALFGTVFAAIWVHAFEKRGWITG